MDYEQDSYNFCVGRSIGHYVGFGTDCSITMTLFWESVGVQVCYALNLLEEIENALIHTHVRNAMK